MSKGFQKNLHIILLHGGAGIDANPLDRFVSLLVKENISYSLPTYPTLAQDKGATLQSIQENITKNLNQIISDKQSNNIFLLGASFGALLAINYLKELNIKSIKNINGLILFNPVTILGPQGWENKITKGVDCEKINDQISKNSNLKKIPVLIFHGMNDRVISYKNSLSYFEKVKNPLYGNINYTKVGKPTLSNNVKTLVLTKCKGLNEIYIYSKMPHGSFADLYAEECSTKTTLFIKKIIAENSC